MERYNVYVDMPVYLRQWVQHHFGCPARFPARSVSNAMLTSLLRTKKGVLPWQFDNSNKMSVTLPWSKTKHPTTYHYLTKEGERQFAEHLHNLLKLQLWSDLYPMIDPTKDEYISHRPILDVIRQWCVDNGVDQDYDYTLKMKWQRMRQAYHFRIKFRQGSCFK